MKTCSLEVALALAALGYNKPTSYIWDRHNPSTREGNDKTVPVTKCSIGCKVCAVAAWKLSPSNGHYDFVCDLRAPTRLKASMFLIKIAMKSWFR